VTPCRIIFAGSAGIRGIGTIDLPPSHAGEFRAEAFEFAAQ
jgi:hypothetical protein